jgi:myo-inositol-1(or 4)-monophosphatase
LADVEKPTDAAAARRILVEAAREAGRIALAHFTAGERTRARVGYKHGGSPVTEADLAVNEFLSAQLRPRFRDAGWLSEETEDDLARLSRERVVVVDPIDGTRAFVAGDPRWTVSIALVESGRPIAGVVHAPALDETFAASRRGGATRNGERIKVSARAVLDGARIGGPRALTATIERAAEISLSLEPKIPSLAYRIALVASGALDVALAADKAHDWDVAAADLILSEAGGGLVDADGEALRYNRPETRRPILVAAPRRLLAAFVSALQAAKLGPSPTFAVGA